MFIAKAEVFFFFFLNSFGISSVCDTNSFSVWGTLSYSSSWNKEFTKLELLLIQSLHFKVKTYTMRITIHKEIMTYENFLLYVFDFPHFKNRKHLEGIVVLERHTFPQHCL